MSSFTNGVTISQRISRPLQRYISLLQFPEITVKFSQRNSLVIRQETQRHTVQRESLQHVRRNFLVYFLWYARVRCSPSSFHCAIHFPGLSFALPWNIAILSRCTGHFIPFPRLLPSPSYALLPCCERTFESLPPLTDSSTWRFSCRPSVLITPRTRIEISHAAKSTFARVLSKRN